MGKVLIWFVIIISTVVLYCLMKVKAESDELHELAESLESDLYILPSSVHEVIAVSSDMGSPEMLAQMVVEVNMQEVSLDERLSNQVYHYDKDLRKLTLATDTPNKRLDGIVAEPPLVYDAKEKSR